MENKSQEQSSGQPTIEEMFKYFLENSPIYIFFKDEKIRALQLSRNYEQMLGRPLEEILGKDMEELFPPDLARSMIADDLKVLREGIPVTIQEELNGHYFTTTKFPIIQPGRPPYMAGYTLDITDLKLTELELKESEKRFRSIIETSQEWIWSIDLQALHTYCNPTVEKILGYRPDEIIGRDIMDLVHSDDLPILQEVFRESVSKKQGWTARVYRWKHKAGGYRYLESNATPIYDNSGELVGFWGSDRDITERVQAEEQRLIMEQQILQAQKLDSLGILAAGIAHDFNNLMSGIFGYINIARENSRDENISNYLDKAMKTIDRARGLTAQLLTFARGGEPVRETIPLSPFVQDTTRFALSGSNVSSAIRIPSNLWHCNVDKNQIGQVIDNIIINAKQAMPQGGEITIQAENITVLHKDHPYLNDGEYVRLSIQDQGPGIPREIQSRIFEPFFTTKPKGQGLGLATCYSIINRHGGAIQVESEPGRGTEFLLYLPAISHPSTDNTTPVVRHQGQGTILIMDDEEVVRDILKEMLESMGYATEVSENGQDLLERFNQQSLQQQLSGVFLDLTIAGGKGGAAVVEEIRRTNPVLPVFVVSGYASDPAMAHPSDYGFTASLCKPFSMDDLSDLLNKNMRTGN